MKKFIAILSFLFATVCFAQSDQPSTSVRFEMDNNAGGKIVLKFLPCRLNGTTYDKLHHAYSYTSQGTTFSGCWAYFDNMVMVSWEDGRRSTFNPDQFQIIKGN